jgi:hypothetical protein
LIGGVDTVAYLLLRLSASPRIVAETATERALLAHGRSSGGRLLLEDAHFPVDGDMLVLPTTMRKVTAQRLCDALATSAERHRQATLRRRRFRLI